jgi:hypothetical protein
MLVLKIVSSSLASPNSRLSPTRNQASGVFGRQDCPVYLTISARASRNQHNRAGRSQVRQVRPVSEDAARAGRWTP